MTALDVNRSQGRALDSNPEHNKSLREHGTALKDDVKHLKDDAYAAATTAGECLSCEAEKVAELAKTGGEKAQQAHAYMRKHVQKHPTTAVLATLGVGILLGRLIAGR